MLQFNDTTNELGLCQEIDSICKSTVVSYPLKQKTRRLNNAIDTYFQKAMNFCGNWSVGDVNNITDIAVATTNLVSGQQDYGLSDDFLVLDSVWLADSTGKFKKLEFEAGGTVTSETGTPTKYHKIENSIDFNVIPNYSYTGGIKIYFRRKLPRFAYTDTTKTSGLPAPHDFYLCRLASLPYLIENSKPQKNDVAIQIAQDEAMLKDYYSFRGRDERPHKLVPARQSNR